MHGQSESILQLAFIGMDRFSGFTLILMTAPEANDFKKTLTKELIVENKTGIHARPAAMIVRVANTYEGDVWVEKDNEQVNGKSIMGLMMLAAGKGSKIVIRAEGPEETGQKMLTELADLFERRFEEI